MAGGADDPGPKPLAQRLFWFIGLWVTGVVSVAAVAYGLKLWIA